MEISKKIFAFVLSGFLFLTVNLSAQTGNEGQNTQEPQTQDPTTTTQDPATQDPTLQQNPNAQTVDTVNATESIVVDTARSSSYHIIAREMTIKLLEKMPDLSFEQAGEVEEILVDYQEDIAEAKTSGTSVATDQSVDNDVDTQSDENTATEDDREMLGGMGNADNLSEIDKEANSEIEDVFEDDQMDTYLFVKEDWWNEVKSKVYGTEDQNQNEQQNMDQNMNQDNNGEGIEQHQPDPDMEGGAVDPNTEQPGTDADVQGETEQGTDTDVQGETEQGTDTDVQGETDQQNQNQDDQMNEDTSPDTGKTLDQHQVPADSLVH